MGIRHYKEQPYYDSYDESKDYVQVLFRSGRYVQAREFTEIGDIYRNFMKNLGDSLFYEGQIISGCQIKVVPPSEKINYNQAVVESGYVYIEGLVRHFEGGTVRISCSGIEYVGIKLAEHVLRPNSKVDEEGKPVDPEAYALLDPAEGTEGWHTEGASRVKQTLSLVANDSEAYNLYTLNNGVVVINSSNNDDSALQEELARRTYDVSGSFKVEGFTIENKDNSQLPETDPDYGKYQVIVHAGRAYVNGWLVVDSSMRTVDLTPPTDSRRTIAEPHTIVSYNDKIALRYGPVANNASISKVTFDCDEWIRGKIRGNTPGDRDFIDAGLIDIIEVWWQGKKLTKNVDYKVSNGFIDWSPAGLEPNPNDSYDVRYRYYYTATLNKDYTATFDADKNVTIQVMSSCEHKPTLGSNILIDYTYILSRIDTLTLDMKNNIDIIKGVPNEPENCKIPRNNDLTKLTLGHVLITPYTQKKQVSNYYTTRLTQAEIYTLKTRIDDIEYNIAMHDLDMEAKQGEDATELRGVFTDGFMGYTKCDIGHEKFNGSVDIDQNEFTVGFSTNYLDMGLSSKSDITTRGRIVSAPYVEEVCLSQPLATTPFLVNPYAVWKDLCTLTIEPSHDNWVTNSKVTIDGGTTTKTATLRRWWMHQDLGWVDDEMQKWNAVGVSGLSGWDSHYESSYQDITVSTTTEPILYMRDRKIKITGMNFHPNEFPIRLKILEKEYKPILPTQEETIVDKGYTFKVDPKGTRQLESKSTQFLDGSWSVPGEYYLMADGEGNVEGYFQLGDGDWPCGSVELSLMGPYSNGRATYDAQGNHVTETSTVRTYRTVIEAYDPLAQTFSFEKDTILTGIDLYFAQKDEITKRGCVLQVRNTENGYPGTTIYDEVPIPYSLINADLTKPVATHIILNQTVYCYAGTQYSFVVLSDSNLYKHWVAEMGEYDVVTKAKVMSNPYATGVMFSSSNGLAWTAHQSGDLTFRLHRAKYQRDGEIIFDNVRTEAADRFVAACTYEDQRNDGVEWFYRVNDASEWIAFSPYRTIGELEHPFTTLATSIDIKAKLHISETTSPVIARDSAALAWFLNDTEATYVSRRVVFEEEFKNIKVNVLFALPNGCSAQVYYQCDDLPGGENKWVLLENPKLTKYNAEFNRYEYSTTVVGATMYRVMVVLKSPSALVKPRMKKLISILNR